MILGCYPSTNRNLGMQVFLQTLVMDFDKPRIKRNVYSQIVENKASGYIGIFELVLEHSQNGQRVCGGSCCVVYLGRPVTGQR